MTKKPTVVQKQLIADTRVFSIERIHLRFSNGAEVDYERLCSRGAGAVLIIPLLDRDTVLLIREYAAGVDRYELGFPKGLIENGESAESAADREIQEEIGYGARRLTVLKTLSVAPGYANFETQIVLAEQLFPKRVAGDEPEPIQVVPWKINEFKSLLEQEDFLEARSVAALYLLQHYLEDRCINTKTW